MFAGGILVDILDQFVDGMGLNVKGTRLTTALDDEPGKCLDPHGP